MRKAIGSLVAGLGATLLMEQASSAIYARHSEATRKREEELRPEMPTTVLVRRAGAALGLDLGDAAAERLGMVSHYGFGAAGGAAVRPLVATGMSPLRAALAVAAAMEVGVDQAATTVLGLTAPTWRFPLVTNIRAVAAHAVYGASLGLMLEAGRD